MSIRKTPPADHNSSLIRLWIVEDDVQYRQTIQTLVESSPGLRCEQTFGSTEAVVGQLERAHTPAPDVVLLDINLPGKSGLDCLAHLKTRCPETRVVMLTIRDDRETVFDALCSGASGYVLKNCPIDELISAIHEAHRGGMLMPSPIARMVLSQLCRPRAAEYGISLREREILEHMVEGLQQKEIATVLGISSATVNNHIQKIYQKLHVNSGSAAVVKAIRERLV